jgi:hypothetical protein
MVVVSSAGKRGEPRAAAADGPGAGKGGDEGRERAARERGRGLLKARSAGQSVGLAMGCDATWHGRGRGGLSALRGKKRKLEGTNAATRRESQPGWNRKNTRKSVGFRGSPPRWSRHGQTAAGIGRRAERKARGHARAGERLRLFLGDTCQQVFWWWRMRGRGGTLAAHYVSPARSGQEPSQHTMYLWRSHLA